MRFHLLERCIPVEGGSNDAFPGANTFTICHSSKNSPVSANPWPSHRLIVREGSCWVISVQIAIEIVFLLVLRPAPPYQWRDLEIEQRKYSPRDFPAPACIMISAHCGSIENALVTLAANIHELAFQPRPATPTPLLVTPPAAPATTCQAHLASARMDRYWCYLRCKSSPRVHHQ